jgi:hypothetical protein
VALGLGIFRAHSVGAEATPTTIPVSITVVGKGQIRLIVAEGSGRPCESSDNHVLFNGHARAGDEVKLTVVAAIGAVCVDHTYGEFRESQWAGGVTWWAGDFGPQPSGAALSIRVSTDIPCAQAPRGVTPNPCGYGVHCGVVLSTVPARGRRQLPPRGRRGLLWGPPMQRFITSLPRRSSYGRPP